jgi:curved DNA-binding protein CbpA
MAEPYVDPYAVLGLARGASADEIKQAYFALVRTHPPERDPAAFKRIRAAYERLRDPQQRLEADMHLLNVWPALARKRRAPKLDLDLHREDVLEVARGLTDLVRTDWPDHHVKVTL